MLLRPEAVSHQRTRATAHSTHPGLPLSVSRRLLEGVGDLDDAQVAAVRADDLETDRQSA
jgi:hypothetical protein